MSPVRYRLYPNELTPDPNDFSARVESIGTADFDMIAQRMSERSTYSYEDITGMLASLELTTKEFLKEGWEVNFGRIVRIFFSIKGVFNNPDEAFDPARHQLMARADVLSGLESVTQDKNIVMEKQSMATVLPIPITFFDRVSDTYNATLTPGKLGRITGERLKWDPAQADEGIFIGQESGALTRVETVDVDVNTASRQVFLVPAGLAAAEDYVIELRSRLGATTLRTGRLPHKLTVA